jgi:hypothetical protein
VITQETIGLLEAVVVVGPLVEVEVEHKPLLMQVLVLVEEIQIVLQTMQDLHWQIVDLVVEVLIRMLLEMVVLVSFLSHIQPKYLKKSYGTTSFARKYTIRI